MKVVLLDVLRGSMHDGPGFRTTIFIKGCPLRCQWCHNPESQEMQPQLSYNASRCKTCGACVAVCERGVHSIVDGLHKVDYQKCIACGACEKACVYKAVSIYGYYAEPREVYDIVIRDKAFYDFSGGGITISGGEPLMHAEFCRTLMEMCYKDNIHTAIETSGFCSAENLRTIMPYTGLFLFDWKLSEASEAQKYTGQSCETIQRNLRMLLDSGANVILRCPIIPGVNDTQVHFDSIRKLLDEYPDLSAEILPYHNFGRGKAENINVVQKEFEVPTEDTVNGYLKCFEKYGQRVKRG